VVWGSGLPYETQVDLWLLQLHADTLSGTSKLRLAAYGQVTDHTAESLCNVVNLLGPSAVVYTADSTLPAKLAAVCPGASVAFAKLPSTDNQP
jgi:hypothetical protein